MSFPVLQFDMEASDYFATTAIAQPRYHSLSANSVYVHKGMTLTDLDSTLSSALLGRARSVAAEHATLSAQLAESFDTKIARRASELAPVTNTLKDWVDTNEVRLIRWISLFHLLIV